MQRKLLIGETFPSRLIFLLAMMLLGACVTSAQEHANVEYLCADWGPAMTAPTNKGEALQFSATEEEIYFLKQVTGGGVSVRLCKMKPDGTDKTDIKELWRNPNYPIDTQTQSTWMDVSRSTRRIALSITYAGSDIDGLWTMNLDGSDLKRLITPEQNEHHLQAINMPSWTPDGKWIVFEEQLRGARPNRFNIAKCDAAGGAFTRILEATEKVEYRQPAVSPDGKRIAFSRYPYGYPGGRYIWVANLDGSEPHPLVAPKKVTDGWGEYPTWSPDGKEIFAVGAWEINATTGEKIPGRSPRLISMGGKVQEENSDVVMPHWGKLGLLCSGWGGAITLVDSKFENQRVLALSGTEERKP